MSPNVCDANLFYGTLSHSHTLVTGEHSELLRLAYFT